MIIRRLSISAIALLLLACGPAVPETNDASDSAAGGTIEDGKALIEQGDFSGGAALFKTIVAQKPRSDQAHFYWGVCLERLGETDLARQEYEISLELNPDLMEAQNNLGLLLLDTGDLDGANKHLTAYLDANGEEADAHYNYGIMLLAMDQKNAARSQFEDAKKLAPNDPLPLLSLGDMERAEGKLEEAIEFYQAARKAAPEDTMSVLSIAQALLSLKKVDEAAATLKGLADMSGSDAATLTTAGMLLAKYDRDDEAIELYTAAVKMDEGYPRAHILLANALARGGKYAEAAAHFEKFIELAPEAPETDAARKGLEICKAKASK